LFTIWSWIKDDIKQVFLLNTISLSHRVWAIFVLICSEIELLNRDFSLWFDQRNDLFLCTTSLDIVLGIPWSENCFPFSSLVYQILFLFQDTWHICTTKLELAPLISTATIVKDCYMKSAFTFPQVVLLKGCSYRSSPKKVLIMEKLVSLATY